MAKSDPIHTPVGVLGFNALFEKDSYRDERTGTESTPKYKADLILDRNDDLDALWDAIYGMALEGSGRSEDDVQRLIDSGHFTVPLKDGDVIKENREARGKNGDAVGGKEVLRAGTAFNADGNNAPGGIYVVDEENKRIDWDRRNKLYLGCRMVFSVTFEHYKNGSNEGVTAYLNGAQFVGDGERLGQDKSALFSPLKASASEARGRGRGRG